MWRYIQQVFKLFLKFSGFQDLLDLAKDQSKELGEMFPEVVLAIGRAFLFIIILISLFILAAIIVTYVTLKMTGI